MSVCRINGVSADDVAGYDKGLLELRVKNVVKPTPQPKRVCIAVHSGDAATEVEGEVAETEATPT